MILRRAAALNINQTLFISHLCLVLIIIVGLSYSRYQSEWNLRVEHATSQARTTLAPHVTFLSGAVAGRNYANLMMPSTQQTLFDIEALLFLQLSGSSDYSSRHVGVRYQRERNTIWRTDVSPNELQQAQQTEQQLVHMLASISPDQSIERTKLNYVWKKAVEDYRAIQRSVELHNSVSLPWQRPSHGERSFFLDMQSAVLHIIIPLRNNNGGELWAVFDTSELRTLQREIWLSLLLEATIALGVSLLLILWVTRRIVSPIKQLAEHMNNDIDHIDLDYLPALNRRDELGILAHSFMNLVTKVITQFRVLERMSETDELTGLGSRYNYTRAAEPFMQQTLKNGRHFGLLVCDIDNFKAYNDNYGHPQGDQALKNVAHTLMTAMEPDDKAYRVGGEEFVVLMARDSQTHIEDSADNLNHAVDRLRMEHCGNPPYGNVTLSIGVCCLHPGLAMARSFSKLFFDAISQADRQLYQAKHQGRNRVISQSFHPQTE